MHSTAAKAHSDMEIIPAMPELRQVLEVLT